MVRHRPRSSMTAAIAVVLLVVCGGCSTAVSGAPAPSEVTGSSDPIDGSDSDATAAEESALPPGATEGFDDFNDDGEPDPTCGNQDYGGGLVVRIPCNYADYAEPPTEDTTLVPNSLFGLPSPELDLTGISGSAVQGRTASGQKLIVLFISSDTLFAVGSSDLSEPATENFNAIAGLIQNNWATAPVQVRGHTDATGSASGNQTLSEQRAARVADHLAGRGIDRSRLSSVGLGPSRPIVLETNADGGINPTGQQYNRRVELAILVP
jgi:outer membrane protein OmpA-like peptidoglycan-associated protein